MTLGISNDYYANRNYNEISNGISINSEDSSEVKTKDDYYNKLCDKFPNIDFENSDYYVNKKQRITMCMPSKVLNKAAENKEFAKDMEEKLAKMPDAVNFINNHNPLPDGRIIKSVSFVADADGNFSCNIEYEQPKKVKNHKDDDDKVKKEQHDKLKKLREKNKYSKDNYVCRYYENVSSSYNSGWNNIDTQLSNIFNH